MPTRPSDPPVAFFDTPGSLGFTTKLRPGDVLVFARKSFFNRLINIKTWSRFSHVEVVASVGPTTPVLAASRNGKGVQFYAPEWKGLAMVLRPRGSLSITVANEWAKTVVGQGYDWLGLLNFTYARLVGRDNGKMFCSEFVTRYLRRAGVPLFPYQDADTIAPRDFLLPSLFTPVWRDARGWEEYWRYDPTGDE